MNQLLERAPRRTRRRVIAVAVASLMLVAACGSDDDESESGSGETTAAATTATTASSATTRSTGSATSAAAATGTGAPATTGTAAPTTAANFPADADPDGRIRIATNLQIGGAQFNLDPFVASSPSYGGMYHLYLGTPLYVSREGTIEPYLAQSYEVRDAQTFVLTLRPGLTFQDGKPYDAAALKAALDEKIAGTLPAYKVGNETGIASITADTPTQMTIKTTGPTAGTMPLLMTEEFSLAVSRAPGNPLPIGAGPYRVTDFQSGLSVRMEKWDGFFRADDFGVKTLEYTNIPDRAAAINALNADQVDFVAASPLDADALTGTGRFEDVVTNTESYYFLRVCLTGPPFNDPTFRNAFAAALNRNRINTNVLGGLGEPMAGLWRSNSPFAYADADAIPADGDPGRAEQLVSELGERPTVRILHFGVETHVRILEAVQAQMADVGIDVELSQFQFGVPSEQQFSAAQGGALMTTLTFSGVGKAMDAVPSLALSARVCPDAETPALTTAVNKLVAGALTPTETAATWQDVQREVVAASSIFPLVSQPVVYVYRNNIKGVVPGVVGLTSTTAPGPFLEGVYVEED